MVDIKKEEQNINSKMVSILAILSLNASIGCQKMKFITANSKNAGTMILIIWLDLNEWNVDKYHPKNSTFTIECIL